MAYTDFEHYANTYHGNAIAQADFPRLAQRASELIDQVTFGRASVVTDVVLLSKVRMAVCAVAEEIASQEGAGGPVTSERVGNYSVTYAAQKSNFARQADAARRYLFDTELMYRGINAS